MVHSHYSFEIRQARSHLFLIRHPRPPRYLKKRKDCGEFLKEISKLESVPETIISRIDDHIKELEEEKMCIDIAIANVTEKIAQGSRNIEAIQNLKQALLRKKN